MTAGIIFVREYTEVFASFWMRLPSCMLEEIVREKFKCECLKDDESVDVKTTIKEFIKNKIATAVGKKNGEIAELKKAVKARNEKIDELKEDIDKLKEDNKNNNAALKGLRHVEARNALFTVSKKRGKKQTSDQIRVSN